MNDRYRLAGLRDGELLGGLAALVRRGNVITADLLAHLAEVDERRLHLELGFQSLFAYCTKELGMCEATAGRRIVAARICGRFPGIFERVASGALQLSTLCALNQYLTPENARELFEACALKSRREVELLLAARFPRPDVVEQVRRLPGTARGNQRGVVEPLSAGRFGVRFTAEARLEEKIERARELARHRLPNGDLATLTELAFDALLDRLQKTRFGVGCKPRAAKRTKQSLSPGESAGAKTPGESGAAKRSRHVPAEVAREVYERDGARCTFVSANGRRCEARAFLEIDHRRPWAAGGVETTENLRLCCQAHNQHWARRFFGRRHMREAMARAQRGPSAGPARAQRGPSARAARALPGQARHGT